MMTAEELRALDVRVAIEVMGLLVCDSPAALELPARCSLYGVRHFSADLIDSDNGDELPHYSADIAGAMLVVEHLRTLGLRPVLMPDWGTQWQCVVYERAEYLEDSPFVDSLPHAICLAALALVTRRKKYGTAYGTETQTNPSERP